MGQGYDKPPSTVSAEQSLLCRAIKRVCGGGFGVGVDCLQDIRGVVWEWASLGGIGVPFGRHPWDGVVLGTYVADRVFDKAR